MKGNNNHYYYNYYINNNSSIRASLNTNITFNSPQSFKGAPNASTKFTSPTFSHTQQSCSSKALPKYKSIKTEGVEEVKNKTISTPIQNKNKSQKHIHTENTETKGEEEKATLKEMKSIPELRTTLDVMSFSPKINPNKFKRETIFSPKSGGGTFWKSRNNSISKTPQNSSKLKEKIFTKNKAKGITRFRLIKLIGQGTFSDVYLAIEKKTLTLWAIKRIKRSLVNTKELQSQFSKIIASQYKFNHPNIMKVYDVFCDESYVYLVEEFMESGTLDKYMKKKANWKEAEAGERISEVCSGMKYIHQKNLIHGGLKPSSILVSHDTCKLPSLEHLNSPSLSLAALCKDLSYTPPEALTSKPLTKAYDLWCIGLILYELHVRKPLFSGTTQKILMRKIINFSNEELKLPSELNEEVEELIRNLLQPIPLHRLTAEELMDQHYIIQHRTDNEWNSLIQTDKSNLSGNADE